MDKKRTKEDTWTEDDLMKHIKEEERRRRERSKRDETHGDRDRRKPKLEERGDERESEKRRERDRHGNEKRNKERDAVRQREKTQGLSKEREREKDRERHKERDRERHRDKDEEKRQRDKERREREREIDRERRKKDGERHQEKDRETARDRDREKERQKKIKEKEKERDREGERSRFKEDKKTERIKENQGSTDTERERDRRDRQRERQQRRDGGEEPRAQEHRDKRHQENHRDSAAGIEPDQRPRERDNGERQQETYKGQKDKHEKRLRSSEQETSRREQEKTPQSHRTSTQTESRFSEMKRDGGTNGAEEEDVDEVYEDDFEDYEEDFEDLEEDDEEEQEESENEEREERREDLSPRRREEIEAIQRAMEMENQLVRAAQNRTPSKQPEPASNDGDWLRVRGSGRVIDFTGARQRERNLQSAVKQKQRSAELMRLIDLDFSVTETLLDLPPVSEYDMYIRSFGATNTKQVYTQCNEDNTERDTQTEETETTDRWTQHPADSAVSCGGPKVQSSQNASVDWVSRPKVDSRRLGAFLQSAAQVMAVLLEENMADRTAVERLQSEEPTHSFSGRSVHLNTGLHLLRGRCVSLLRVSHTHTHTLLSVHTPHTTCSADGLDGKTILCVWNIREPSAPHKILVYEAEVRSCCFSPGKAALVFAGTAVGSVVLWDLREPSSTHVRLRDQGAEWTLRYPTFSTDAVMSGVGHFSSVVSVEPVGAGLTDPMLPDQDESLGLSFQLGSLDENGLLDLWVVVELSKSDDAGSQTDLGLRPSGRVKLLHSSSLQTTPPGGAAPSLVLKFLPSDSNHYLIGSDMGLVRHGTRHGVRAVPKLYTSKEGRRPTEVTALEFCPSGDPFFLVGCSDGSVRLHSLSREDSVWEWTPGSVAVGIQCVQFNPTRPSVFCVLDSASVLHIWDLTERITAPLITEDLHSDPVMAVAGFGGTVKQNWYSGVVLGKESGRVEIHFFIPALSLPRAADPQTLHSLTEESL